MALTARSTRRACYTGYITQAIVNNLAPLLFVTFQTQYQLTLEQIGRLALTNFVAQLVVDILAVKLVDKTGYRIPAVAAHGFCVIGLVGLGVLPGIFPSPYLGLLTAVILYAVGGGLLEVIISPIVDSLPSDDKSSAMSLLHSFYSWGQAAVILLSTLLLRLIGSANWSVLPIFWALLPLCNLILFCRVPLASTVSTQERTSMGSLLRSPDFLLALVVMLCAGASEMMMSQWASLFAEEGLGVTKVLGDLAGPCLFAVLMGVARTIYGVWGEKIQLHRALTVCGLLCVLCYSLTVLAPLPAFSLAGCALCGFAVGILWPGTLSICSARFPLGGVAMFGMLAIAGDLGCSLGPWITGIASQWAQHSPALMQLGQSWNFSASQTGLRFGLAAGTLFPIVLLGALAILSSRSRRRLREASFAGPAQ